MVTEKFIHVRPLQDMDEEPPMAGQDQMLSLNNTLKCLGLSQTLGGMQEAFLSLAENCSKKKELA